MDKAQPGKCRGRASLTNKLNSAIKLCSFDDLSPTMKGAIQNSGWYLLSLKSSQMAQNTMYGTLPSEKRQ